VIYTVTLNTAVDRTIEVPGLKIAGVLSGRTICEQAAGKGVNISRCLATLEIESDAGGFVGMEEASAFASSFAGTRARTRFIAVPGRTRRDTTLLDPVAHTDTHIRESGYVVAPEHLDALRADLAAHTKPGDILVFCGSLPPGVTPEAFAALIKHMQGLGRRAAVDTSGDALRAALGCRPFLMKPNRSELETLMRAAAQEAPASPRALVMLRDVVAAGRSLLGAVQTLLVSLGQEGAVLISSEGVWHGACRVAPADVKSTVGCGDALLAGYLAGVEQKRTIAECLRMGVACGSACALTPAAGLIYRADVERLLRETRVERI